VPVRRRLLSYELTGIFAEARQQKTGTELCFWQDGRGYLRQFPEAEISGRGYNAGLLS
jgi:hypothetical protein